jgi:hypothetical protein
MTIAERLAADVEAWCARVVTRALVDAHAQIQEALCSNARTRRTASKSSARSPSAPPVVASEPTSPPLDSATDAAAAPDVSCPRTDASTATPAATPEPEPTPRVTPSSEPSSLHAALRADLAASSTMTRAERAAVFAAEQHVTRHKAALLFQVPISQVLDAFARLYPDSRRVIL